jgi:ribosome production factor 1
MPASKKVKLSDKAALPFKTGNRQRRQDFYVKQRIARDKLSREERFHRKKAETKDPRLREERQRRNVPLTLERKRVWDAPDEDVEGGLGLSVDVERVQAQTAEEAAEEAAELPDASEDVSDEVDSMIGSESTDGEEEESAKAMGTSAVKTPTERATSPTQSATSTNLNLTPEALAARFPAIMSEEVPPVPKVLITTSINSNLRREAQLLTSLFPHSVYIPRSAHRRGHKYSVREIAKYAANRNYTAVMVLMEDQKRPSGLDFVHLPNGPMFHFSITNWVEGKVLPGHGNPTEHVPELILNSFRTPLGLLTAHMFRRMFPPQPEFAGRQVVTLHNQRDYIFVRRHRYVFRHKRETEKAVVGSDGKEMKGAEGVKAGLQELGPRFTLKLRRIDKGIQRGSGQEWEWKGRLEKTRTRFQL